MIAVIVILAVAAALPLTVLLCAHTHRAAERADCLIVLGCKVHPDRTACTALKLRCAHAARLMAEGRVSYAIVCGGQVPPEPCTEAEVMRAELVSAGVAADRVLCEDRSMNTAQNFLFATAIMRERGLQTAIVVTSDYHLTRALWLARDMGVPGVSGSAAPAPKGLRKRVKQISRECVSWVLYRYHDMRKRIQGKGKNTL